MAALSASTLKLPVKPPPITCQPHLISQTRLLPPVSNRFSPFEKTLTLTKPRKMLSIKALEEKSEEAETEIEIKPESSSTAEADATEIGEEIKKAMEQRKRKEEEGGSLWSGVAEEIREIEWPAFGKVLGTTGVVLGVIAGSSVVLLTVNFVLAELSDRVFAGKGIQDFLS